MLAIMVFGPGHGYTLEIREDVKELVWLDPDNCTIFEASKADTAAEAMRMLRESRIARHQYRFSSSMSSAAGEDCSIFVHSESCCDAMMPMYEGKPQPNREERYKEYLRSKYAMNRPIQPSDLYADFPFQQRPHSDFYNNIMGADVDWTPTAPEMTMGYSIWQSDG